MAPRIYGAFTDRTDPGYHLVGLEDVPGLELPVELIEVPLWEEHERTLLVGYRAVAEDLSDEAAQTLIADALLFEFYAGEYDEAIDYVVFIEQRTGRRRRRALVGGELRDDDGEPAP